jgi:hypothetical protein
MSLAQYLKQFMIHDKDLPVTHHSIGNVDLNVYPGKYHIPDDKLNEFYKIYKEYVFQEKKQAYLTEKQIENGKILFDLDFRYPNHVQEKQYSKKHVIDFIKMTLEGLCDIYQQVQSNHIEFYVFEKDNVKTLENVTRDGIHIMLNVQADFATKMILRDYLIQHISEIWDFELENTWENVFDECTMKGHINWQLYGSQKPGNEGYKLKYIFDSYHDETNMIHIDEVDTMKINFDEYFPKFCARNTNGLHKFRLQEKYIEKHQKYSLQINK